MISQTTRDIVNSNTNTEDIHRRHSACDRALDGTTEYPRRHMRGREKGSEVKYYSSLRARDWNPKAQVTLGMEAHISGPSTPPQEDRK